MRREMVALALLTAVAAVPLRFGPAVAAAPRATAPAVAAVDAAADSLAHGHDVADATTLYNAGINYKLGDRPKTAISLFVEFTSSKDKLYRESPYYLDAMRWTALSYQGAFDYPKALSAYLDLYETAKLAKKELSNMVDGWQSSNKSGGGGGVQSDQQESGGQMGQSGSSQGGERPFH